MVPLVSSEEVLTLADVYLNFDRYEDDLAFSFILLFLRAIIDPHPPHHHLIPKHYQDMSLDELIEKDYLPPKVPKDFFFPFKKLVHQ